MCELMSPVLNGKRCACETGMVSVSGDTTTALVGQEFEVEESAVAFWETAENVRPAALVFVAVRELDVRVDEWDWSIN